jgi:hypothetical protein
MAPGVQIRGLFYRLLPAGANPLAPARHPKGRSHYGGQPALYLSESPEGCRVAVRRYRTPDDPVRVIVPLSVTAHVFDLRDAVAAHAYGIDPERRTIEWQPIVAAGSRSPTWDISDRVRELALDGMLYASRSQPDLTHLTLFRWNDLGGATVARAGPNQVDTGR